MNPHRNFYPFPPVLCKIQSEAVSKLPHLELRDPPCDPLREQVVLSILQFVTERVIERVV